jgi:hypothetical protein
VKSGLERKFATQPDPNPRHYRFLEVAFSGAILDLSGHEAKYPDLASPTESGYPFCQSLAAKARAMPVDGLHTPSARRKDGTCVPVFTESALGNESFAGHATFTPNADGAVTVHVSENAT